MKKLFAVLLLLVVAVAAVGFVAPTEYDVGTSTVIDASPEAVHAYVGDLERWPEWSPWEQNDPSVKVSMGATSTGVGASQSWTSDDGDGELTFTASDPATGIAYEMAFVMDGERFPAQCSMTYELVDGGTQVTWAMQGDWKGAVPPVLDGLMQLMSAWMIGGEFDKGLASLKQKVEAGA
ncbi:MAG: hypothetical protein DRQ55_05650 [Planctomycetota bacterium]|nr:MAG: hypothetical protein DRQ55_05650 [Planctomycetota bacterium]